MKMNLSPTLPTDISRHDVRSHNMTCNIDSYNGKDSFNGETIKKLYEMGDRSPARKLFLDEYFSFMQARGRPVTKIPVVAKLPLDLYQLYVVVQNYGGFSQVVKKRRWSQVVRALKLPTSITSAAFTLRTQYLRLLYHFECEKKGLSPAYAGCYDFEYFDNRESFIGHFDSPGAREVFDNGDTRPRKRPCTAEDISNSKREYSPIERSHSSDEAVLCSIRRENIESNINRIPTYKNEKKLIDLSSLNENNEKIRNYFRDVEYSAEQVINTNKSLDKIQNKSYDKIQNNCSCLECVRHFYHQKYSFEKSRENSIYSSSFTSPPTNNSHLYSQQTSVYKTGVAQQKQLFPYQRSGMDINVIEQTESALMLTVVFNGRCYNGTLLSGR